MGGTDPLPWIENKAVTEAQLIPDEPSSASCFVEKSTMPPSRMYMR